MNKITVANIQSYSMISREVGSVVASTFKVETAKDYAEKVSKLFDGKLEVVPLSVRNVTRNENAKAVAFHVRAVRESQPIEAAAQMREVVTANVFADAEDATWEVVEAAGVKRLVKRTDTDISALLAAASRTNLNRIAASAFDADVGAVQQGEYAIFTNPETASVDGGIIYYGADGAMNAISRTSGQIIPLNHDAVIAHSAWKPEAEVGEETAAFEVAFDSTIGVDSFVAYFRKLYGNQPGFFTQLEAAIRKGFTLG